MDSYNSPSPSPSTPWAVLVLVAQHLDPKTLAIASCVSKSWSISMSSDHLWKPIFTTHFPSLSNLAVSSSASLVSFHRLFALGHTAATRRQIVPSKPLLSLSDLFFSVTVSTAGRRDDAGILVSCTKSGTELADDPNGLFKFVINLDGDGDCTSSSSILLGSREEVRVTWNVVLEGWRGVFTMIECGGEVGMAPRADGWFSEELPAPGCCSNTITGGIVADLKLGLSRNDGEGEGEGEKMRIERVSVGMLNIVSWRYISVEDGLRYLQHFLLG